MRTNEHKGYGDVTTRSRGKRFTQDIPTRTPSIPFVHVAPRKCTTRASARGKHGLFRSHPPCDSRRELTCHRSSYLGNHHVLHFHSVTRSLQPVPDVAQVPLHFVSSQPRALSLATGNGIARVISCTQATARQHVLSALLVSCSSAVRERADGSYKGAKRGNGNPVITNADHRTRTIPSTHSRARGAQDGREYERTS